MVLYFKPDFVFYNRFMCPFDDMRERSLLVCAPVIWKKTTHATKPGTSRHYNIYVAGRGVWQGVGKYDIAECWF